MTRQSYQAYLQTPYWKATSRMVKERAKFRCQICNSPKNLETHHRSYQYLGKEQEHLEDLVCLCDPCHERHHFGAKPVVVVKKVEVIKFVKGVIERRSENRSENVEGKSR